jgi:hypothetical protein
MTSGNAFRPSAEERAKALVDLLVEAGCDMVALGPGYILNEPEDPDGRAQVEAILESFGPRDDIKAEISGYLRSIGRFLDLSR